MVGAHNTIPNNHFHKKWARWTRQNFNEVFRKRRRQKVRARKARALAPRPIKALQPIVRCPTARYNAKQRYGRGFSLAEIRAVGMSAKEARSVGIKVDRRRRNVSVEGLMVNTRRLKEYKSKLILFPKQSKKLAEKQFVTNVNAKPVDKGKPRLKSMLISEAMKKFEPYVALRRARGEIKKLRNKRKKLAKKKVEDL